MLQLAAGALAASCSAGELLDVPGEDLDAADGGGRCSAAGACPGALVCCPVAGIEGPGLCVDLSWHPYHCGACNRACGMVCTGGECL